MVCTANELSTWKDFPKGLKILLIDEDIISAQHIKSQLQAMDYVVTIFVNVSDALTTISANSECFHVAIVEVTKSNIEESFKFLENVKDIPIVMTSTEHCLSIMMKCIALGAVEFIQKPVSADKLRNMWQHVVHKTFNAGQNIVTESINPVMSILHRERETEDAMLDENLNLVLIDTEEQEVPVGNDKYPAPSTPQLEQDLRLLDDTDCQDHPNFSMEHVESQFAETTYEHSPSEVAVNVPQPETIEDHAIEKNQNVTDGSKNEDTPNTICGSVNPSEASRPQNKSKTKSNRKKMKVDWTSELHKKFVKAVEQLGADQAIPSRILELMKIDGLTRHNVASHLQKYRMHRRHILPKGDEKRWEQSRDQMHRSYYPHKPIMAFPPYHLGQVPPIGPMYPIWGGHTPSVPMWGPTGYPTWQRTESWYNNKPYPELYADTWGCPVMPPPHGPCPAFPHHIENALGIQVADFNDNNYDIPNEDSYDILPADETIDKVVKEAISKPWLPLPLGLKPPSTDCVLAELSKQGISTVPSHINGFTSY